MSNFKKIASLVLIGLIPNVILAFIIKEMAYAGHSPVALIVAYLLPFLATLSYMSYVKLNRILVQNNKKILLFSFTPSFYISLLILILVMSLCFFYDRELKFLLEYLWFSLLFIIIIIIPNFIFQCLIYLLIIKKFKECEKFDEQT